MKHSVARMKLSVARMECSGARVKHFGYRIHRPRALPLDLVRAHPDPPFSLTFDGQEIQALPGQTVAAALWSAGITAWRTTRGSGSPRGVFCGIGVCFDCLVTVDGRPNQRACLVPAEPGAEVRTQRGTGHDD